MIELVFVIEEKMKYLLYSHIVIFKYLNFVKHLYFFINKNTPFMYKNNLMKMVSFVVMAIDKSWIDKPHDTLEYENGLIKFLNFAFEHKSIDGLKIKCPCSKCGFKKWRTWDEAYVDLKK